MIAKKDVFQTFEPDNYYTVEEQNRIGNLSGSVDTATPFQGMNIILL